MSLRTCQDFLYVG